MAKDQNGQLITLPHIIQRVHTPAEDYILPPRLKTAVEVALALGQPLLLTGEPGTGKTSLADRIALDLSKEKKAGFGRDLLKFDTKTSSAYTDLLYQYDTLGHFQAANIEKDKQVTASQFIQLEALGRAIALTNPGQAKDLLGDVSAQSSVVLIDEIDKAPRDFPNDLLNELDKFSFKIREDNYREISMDSNHRVVVIITSNSEKTLPDAFLRRCVFFHIEFPKGEDLLKIVRNQMGETSNYGQQAFIEHFEKVRDSVRKKKPATAELLSWLRILELHKFASGAVDFSKLNDTQKGILQNSYSVLAKTVEDLRELESKFLK